jgi:hypothetical protein
MNTDNRIAIAFISPADIENIMIQAREERAEVMRAALAKFVTLFKRLAARIRPNRQRLPQAGAWA